MCTDGYLNEGRIDANLMNSSQDDMQQMSPNVRTGLSRNYDKAFAEFQKFMQGLRAEDLFALKQFLLVDLSYNRPVSVNTVPESAKPSVMPSAEDFPGTFLTVNFVNYRAVAIDMQVFLFSKNTSISVHFCYGIILSSLVKQH